MAYGWLDEFERYKRKVAEAVQQELAGGKMASGDMMSAQQLAGFGVDKLLAGGVPVTITVALDNGYLVVFVPKRYRPSGEGPDIDDTFIGGAPMIPQQLRPMRGRPVYPGQSQPQAPPPMPPDEIEKRRRAMADHWKEERKKSAEHEARVRVYPTLSLAMADIESFMKNGIPPNVKIDEADLSSGPQYVAMA